MNVRELGLDAAGEILTLQRAAFAVEVRFTFPNYTDPITQTLEELRAEFLDKNAVALGIRDRGRLIAALRMRPLEDGAIFFYRLSTAPDRVGEGLGRTLMQAAIDRVRDFYPQATRIEFSADGDNNWLISWYERLGFKVTVRGTENGPGEWRLAMDLPADEADEKVGQ